MERVLTTFSCKMRCNKLETPCMNQRYIRRLKQVLVKIKNIEMKVQQLTIELNDPHGLPHYLSAHVNNH